MAESVIQTSFSSGELAPSIFARTDVAQYHRGAATMRNFFVDYRSGASTRTGTKYINTVFDFTHATRLVPFQQSATVAYVLEFGHQYIRFYSNGASVLEPGFAITGATNSQIGKITAVGNNFIPGDWVFVVGIGGATQYNGNYFIVNSVGNVVSLNDLNGNPINANGYGAYTSGGTISRVFKIQSPYAGSDLNFNVITGNSGIKFVQSVSVLTITHPSYPPFDLTFFGPTTWDLRQTSFAPTISPPTNVAGTITGGTGTVHYSYAVTAVDVNGQETIAALSADFSGGNVGVSAGTVHLTWTASAGASFYNIYKAEVNYAAAAVPAGAAYGFLGSCTGTDFLDSNIVPDFTNTPPITNNPFAGSNNPGAVCYFQQRRYFAGSTSGPQTFWGSQPGLYNDFNYSNPTQPDDYITGTLVSLQLNPIKWMLPMPGGLIFGTAAGAWSLTSGQGGTAYTSAVTPLNATAAPQAYNGASDIQPIVSNYDILYVQSKGSRVRDLSYNVYANIYTGADISIFSNHLFYGHQIVSWAYAEEPFQIIWAVREDGILLSLTFVKEQEIFGWARHDTLGLFQSVCTVTETVAGVQVNAVYFIVKRLVGGQYVQFVERMQERTFLYGAEDAWAVDAGLQSAFSSPSANLTISASTGSATFTADSGVFTTGSVGQVIRAGGGIATVTTFVSSTQVIGTLTQPITQTLPNDPNATPVPIAAGMWAISPTATTFSGLNYLNGSTVSILADGGVVTPQVVTNGQVTIPNAASKVTIGLGYTCDLQTMKLDVGEPTIQGKRKKIAALTVRAKDTRGLQAGSSFSTLVPIKELNRAVPIGSPVPLVSADERVIMDPAWTVEGQICLRVSDPLLATVLGVIPEIVVGDTK